jgi:hypothetical protein
MKKFLSLVALSILLAPLSARAYIIVTPSCSMFNNYFVTYGSVLQFNGEPEQYINGFLAVHFKLAPTHENTEIFLNSSLLTASDCEGLNFFNTSFILPPGVVNFSVRFLDELNYAIFDDSLNTPINCQGCTGSFTAFKEGPYKLLFFMVDDSYSNSIESKPMLIKDQNFNLGKTPVIFIPGTMGTEIFKGTEKLWPDVQRMFITNNDRFMDPLSFQTDGSALDNSLSLGNILEQPSLIFDYTKKLKQEFAAQGYEENKDLFMFPYDWREDISKNANLYLSEKISELASSSPTGKVDVIAHSQGGLLIKRLIFEHPEFANKISKLIFLGTPHLGAPKAAKVLLYGDNMGVSFAALGLDPQELKRISQNVPAVYEMLPSPEYFKHSSGYWGTLEVPWFSDPKVTLYDYQTTKEKLKSEGYNTGLLDAAESFHSVAYDNFDFSNTGIETYNIMGCESPTLSTMLVKKFGEDKFTYSPGDGTVPIFSANNTIATHNFYVLDSDDLHGKMPSFEGVRQKVVNIISGSNLPTSKISSDASECEFNGTQVSTHSPVDMHIYDENNNHVGPTDNGSIENSIPGVAYDVIEHQTFAFLPKGHTFTLKLSATDAGSFNFHSEIISGGQSQGSVYFSNIPVILGSKAEINLNETNTQPILLDTDGNGSVDQTFLPTSVLDANQSQDLLPPVSTSTLSGTMGQEGFYRSNVNLELSAKDFAVLGLENQTSELLKLDYKIDSNIWQSVLATSSNLSLTLSFEGEGNHEVSYFATDKAGNTEEPKSISFTIDKTLPEISASFSVVNKDFSFTSDDVLVCQPTECTATDKAGNRAVLKFENKTLPLNIKNLLFKNISYNGVLTNFEPNVLSVGYLQKSGSVTDITQTEIVKNQQLLNLTYIKSKNQTTITDWRGGSKTVVTKTTGLKTLEISTTLGKIKTSIK